MVRIPKDFLEFFKSLNDHDVRYVVVGGYAVAYHGSPRFTGDIDVWVAHDHTNARGVVAALEDFGFSGMHISVDDFTPPDRIVQLGVPPMRIDILTGIDGVSFADAWKEREQVDIDDVPVFFVSRRLLMENKAATGRTKDLADLESLGEDR